MVKNNIHNGVPRFLKQNARNLAGHWKKLQEFHAVAGRFYPYVRKNMKRLVLAQVAAAGYILMGMLEPWPMKLIFDNVLLKRPLPVLLAPVIGFAGDHPILLLTILIASIVVIAFVRGVFYYYQRLLASRSGQRITADLRVDLYSHLQGLSFSFHDRRRTGDLLSRLTTDIRILRQTLISLPLTITSELGLMVGMVVVMLLMDWQLSLLALTVVPLLGMLLAKYQRPMKQAIRKQREREGHLASIASEVLGAIRVVKGFHQEDAEVDKFTVQNKSSLRSGLRAARIEAKLKWASELAVALIMALVLGVAAYRVLSGRLSPGDILVFVAYLKQFNRPLRRISRFTEQAARGTASGERILRMLDIRPLIKDKRGAVKAGRLRGDIVYKNVSFEYQTDVPVLDDVNLRIERGQRVAIVGPTGCGKSTLASLLPRFYDATAGAVMIDSRDVRDYKLRSLRENIALVFQEPVLFATTIVENIAYGKPDSSAGQIAAAAERAGIHHIIEELPEGYETTLGERGGTLSGGQRQCIAIARAIIKDAPIVILDEPTVGLDNQSALLVMGALRELMAGKTVLVISHQLGTLRDVDKVVVLRQGEVVQEGSPSEVFSGSNLYEELRR
ncbi:MAG: ABC transporter ATP-binding protein [Planctomycetota bacterium]|jgi:ATP-binding cassette subfamily B protein